MRFKMKELEDYSWFPDILRKYQMELIGMTVSYFGFYRKIAEFISADFKSNAFNGITDLCSGSGFPAMYIHRTLSIPNLKTLLTDKYPQKIMAESGITYADIGLDINDLHPNSNTYYTMYNAFHHLNDDEQKSLVQKILSSKSQLMIVEIVQPNFVNVVLVTLASTVGVFFVCPLIRPFEWRRLFFTYILPINVLTVMIDGYISIIKSKSMEDYKRKFHSLFPNEAGITIREMKVFPTCIISIKVNGL